MGDTFSLVSGRSCSRKNVEQSPFNDTQDLISEYIFFLLLSVSLQLSNYPHRPTLQTLSKALIKSKEAQYSFNLGTLRYSIRACITNILSNVEYDARKPH